ncbi:hypothetical protein WKW80_11710 [Variovorax humicola]|uniref:Chemotaxis protein n=1 Tax=Variovorax humicola TaxID=1769758 RepID=A0ABU8VZ77_9BURK
MSNSSILGGEHAPTHPRGTDVDALGPSNTSDSGSDVQTDRNHSALPDEGDEGAFPIPHDSSSDAGGTGERASADASAPAADADILPDRIGIVPQDAMDAAVSIDDPEAASVEELAASEDDEADNDEEDADGPA